MDAILYILATGCQWRALPHDFPPRSTVQYYFYGWRETRLWRRFLLVVALAAVCIYLARWVPFCRRAIDGGLNPTVQRRFLLARRGWLARGELAG